MKEHIGWFIAGLLYLGTCAAAPEPESGLSKTCIPLTKHDLSSGHVVAGCAYQIPTREFHFFAEAGHPMLDLQDLQELCGTVGTVSEEKPSYAFVLAKAANSGIRIQCHIRAEHSQPP